MISFNHDLKLKSSTILHAYKIATNPRKPAQILTTPPYPSRKFGSNRASLSHLAPSTFAASANRTNRQNIKALHSVNLQNTVVTQ
jgi:hypothetical protein